MIENIIANTDHLPSLWDLNWNSCSLSPGLTSRATLNSPWREMGGLILQPRALKPQLLQPVLHIGDLHEQIPDETAAIVLDHDHDGALIYSQVAFGIPVAAFAEPIDEAVLAPNLISKVVI